MNNKYPYISENVPDEKISYSYSLFRGADFIEDWIESRNQYIIGEVPTDFNPVETVIEGEADVATAKLFRSWLFSFDRGKGIKEELLDLLVKRFEVTKKIFGDYDENFRPKDKRDFRNASLYILYSTVLIYAYRKKPKLQYLNALLKVNDIICSMYYRETFNRLWISWIIINEIEIIDKLFKKLNFETA